MGRSLNLKMKGASKPSDVAGTVGGENSARAEIQPVKRLAKIS
jgi:hypothetical protein